MPVTINGIGTHYYGKKNRTARTSVCESCRRVGELESYETRLWFVVLFIPLISLGRKWIIDQCPYCRRHRVADADAYERAREIQTVESVERSRHDPSSKAAIEAHGQLLSFRNFAGAAQFRQSLLERFPEDAGLRVGLAAQLRQISAFDESAALYEDALKLDPYLPEARVGVAMWKMAIGELDQARGLLDFLTAPGSGRRHSLGPLDALAAHYQLQGRHEEALDLAGHLLRELPDAGQKPAFRSFVRKSEKALDRWETILPPKAHSLRGLFRAEGSPYPGWLRRTIWGCVGLALVLAIPLGSNEYVRQHRTLHVVNACGKPVKVRVDEGPPQEVVYLGRLAVSEGRHRVRVSGPVQEDQVIDLRTGYFDRWFKRPVWVLNPDREAVIEVMTVYYAAFPSDPDRRLIVGKPFFLLPHVDYPFEEPPDQLMVERPTAPETKIAVQWLEGQDADAFVRIKQSDQSEALPFAERRLRRNPNQLDLLSAYLRTARPEDQPRVEAFLKSELGRRPVLVHWHRAFQLVAKRANHDQDLPALYDRALKSEPENGALMYLRGRVEPDWERQEALYRSAIAADPRLPWPWLGLGLRAVGGARWDDARQCFVRALVLRIDFHEVRELLHDARIALGEAPILANEDRACCERGPIDVDMMALLCDAMVEAGREDQIQRLLDDWIGRLPSAERVDREHPIRALTLYQTGKFAECQQYCQNDNDLPQSILRAQSLLALGRAQQVASDRWLANARDDSWTALALSLGLSLEGHPDEADRWREHACRILDTRIAEIRQVATVLRAAEPTPMEDLNRILLDPQDKALLLAVLAQRFPAQRAEYLAAAARFNVTRRPSYYLVRRAIEGATDAIP